jgi:hypothetical protein
MFQEAIFIWVVAAPFRRRANTANYTPHFFIKAVRPLPDCRIPKKRRALPL